MNRTAFRRAALGLAATLGMLAGASERAEAAFTFTMQQSGSNVVVTGSGTFNPLDLPKPLPDARSTSFVGPQSGTISVGGYQVDAYLGLGTSGPINFGPGVPGPALGTTASSSSGDPVYFSGARDVLLLPPGYAGGGLSNSMTFADQTFASLGITPGSYTWTFGTGRTEAVNLLLIGNVAAPEPAPVPEPASALPLGAGLLGLAALRRGNRRCDAWQNL